MKLPHPLPGYMVGPYDLDSGINYGTSEAHVERLGPGRFAVDIPAPEGTPIPLPIGWQQHDGGEDGERGRWVTLHHWDAQEGQAIAMYCHLRDVGGDGLVGTVGQTGSATGPHLHYVLWRSGERVRPEDWIDWDGTHTPEPDTSNLVQVTEDAMLRPEDTQALRDHFSLIEGCLILLDRAQMIFPLRVDPATGEDSLTFGDQGRQRLAASREILSRYGL